MLAVGLLQGIGRCIQAKSPTADRQVTGARSTRGRPQGNARRHTRPVPSQQEPRSPEPRSRWLAAGHGRDLLGRERVVVY